MADQAHFLPGTLDPLILRAVSLSPLHRYGVLLRIGQISGDALSIEQGALYPGPFRLVRQSLIKADSATSENDRAPGSTNSASLAASVCAKRPTAGTDWRPPSPALSQQPEET
jgi:hypothetical protein